MTESVTVRAAAKVNLHLGVGRPRPDGYHPLATVYQTLSLHDDVTVTTRSQWEVELVCEDDIDRDAFPAGKDNIVVRAGRLLAAHHGVDRAAELVVRKSIPIAGGLAGGSADAAATLLACDVLWGTGFSREELAEIGAELGSDIPFLLHGGTALGTGRGEAVSQILARPTTWHWVVALADGGLSTPDVYRELDRLRAAPLPPAPLERPDALMAALRQRKPEVLGAALANDLQPAAVSLRPELADVLKCGYAAGALAGIVSGSGPTCVFLASDSGHADELAAALESAGVCREAVTARGPMPGARVT